MTVQSDETGVCLVMNAISTRPSATSMTTQNIHLPEIAQGNLNCKTGAESKSVSLRNVPSSETKTTLLPQSEITNTLTPVSMAVTSTVPTGTRSISPCSATIPYGNSSMPGRAPGAAGCSPMQLPALAVGSSSNTGGTLNTNPLASNRCCDTGRTIYTDPVSGQTLCSCQYDMISYQRLAAAGSLVPGSGNVSLGVYPESVSAYLSGITTDQSQFYANTSGLDLKENLVAGTSPWPYPSMYHPYDAAFAGYPFNSYGMDLNGARRKNATRETTSTLKAWLNEHKKNPYPTKGEKIMLAIITKMTLTQVSTWFANARRRLKKENKMTWEPRNRVDDDDANIDDDDHKSTDDNDLLDPKDSCLVSNEEKDRPGRLGDILADRPTEGNNSEWSGSRPGSPNGSPDPYERPGGGITSSGHPLFHPAAIHHQFRPQVTSPTDIVAYHHHQQQLLQQHQQTQQNNVNTNVTASTVSSLTTKPRIWSLADMASKDAKNSIKENTTCYDLPSGHPAAYTHSGQHPSSGKIVSPLPARISNYAPYVRPDIYRGFYGSSTTTHMSGNSQDFIDHQRAFTTNLAVHNPLLWKAAVSGSSGSPHFTSLSLSTNHSNIPTIITRSSGISPSDSSSSSSNGCDVIQSPLSDTPIQINVQPLSGNSTSLSSNSSQSGKLSPSINVTSPGNIP